MENLVKQPGRHNAELVDELFDIMFGAALTSPTNRMRNAQAFLRFEQQSRRLAVLLTTTDFATADDNRLKQVWDVSGELAASIGELSKGRLIVRIQAEKAAALMQRIREAAGEALTAAAGIPSR